jgi:hypothetical protein
MTVDTKNIDPVQNSVELTDDQIDLVAGGGHQHCKPTANGGEWYSHPGMGLHKH